MKKVILTTIYNRFAHWSTNWRFSCRPGCSTCCTTSVTITALEGRRILEYCYNNHRLEWLVSKLAIDDSLQPQTQTTNEFVAAALDGLDQVQSPLHSRTPCPFLERAICTIYDVRPFSCRCFASTRPCYELNTATVSDDYLYGSTAAMQLIEHLGQFDFWGYLPDILLLEVYRKDAKSLPDHNQGRQLLKRLMPRLRRAQPLPGFIFPEENKNTITSLLNDIFSSRIGKYTIEEIFNGKNEGDSTKTTGQNQQ